MSLNFHILFSFQFNFILLYLKKTCLRTLSILNFFRGNFLFLQWSLSYFIIIFDHIFTFQLNSIQINLIQFILFYFTANLCHFLRYFRSFFLYAPWSMVIGLHIYNTLHKQVHVTQYPYPFSFEFNSNQFYFVIFQIRTCLRTLSFYIVSGLSVLGYSIFLI